MGRGRSREPRRSATRKLPSLLLMSSDPPSAEGSQQASGGLAGDVDAPDGLIGAATASLLAAIAEARSPLAAELVLCGAFGAVETGLPDDADEQERLEALSLMLGQVIGHGEMIASVEALALLRVCSVLGPATSRSAARESAGRLAAAGVADRPWAGRVGRPAMLRAWRYGDVFGAQSSVGVLFDYRGREHVVMVLVDHLLGGGSRTAGCLKGGPPRTCGTPSPPRWRASLTRSSRTSTPPSWPHCSVRPWHVRRALSRLTRSRTSTTTSTWYGPGWSISPDWPGYRRSATAETLWASRHRKAALSATNGIEGTFPDRLLCDVRNKAPKYWNTDPGWSDCRRAGAFLSSWITGSITGEMFTKITHISSICGRLKRLISIGCS